MKRVDMDVGLLLYISECYNLSGSPNFQDHNIFDIYEV